MKKLTVCLIMSLFLVGVYGMASAHYGMVIPSDSMVMQGENKVVKVTLSFSHPFEGHGMELVKPGAFGVMANGKKADLLGKLNKTKVMDHTAWTIDYKIDRPGVYMPRTALSSITQRPWSLHSVMMKAGMRKSA
jgi:cobalt/nickel transport protein